MWKQQKKERSEAENVVSQQEHNRHKQNSCVFIF